MHINLRSAAGGAILAATAPLVDLPTVIRNDTTSTLECHAVAGHWYGFDLGTIAPGAQARVTLGLDRRDGTVSLPNPAGARVPIQYMYCGVAGDAWHTRADLPLRRMAQESGTDAIATCHGGPAGLRCE